MIGPNCGWLGSGPFFGGPLPMIAGIVFWALVIYGIFCLTSRLIRRPSDVVQAPN